MSAITVFADAWRILVNEGDYVTQGQPLVELDSTLTSADKQKLDSELLGLQLHLAVNNALLGLIDSPADQQAIFSKYQLKLETPSEADPAAEQLHKRMLWQQWIQHRSQLQSFRSNLDKTSAEQAASRETITKLEKILPIAKQRAKALQVLRARQNVSEYDYMQAEQEFIRQPQDLKTEKQRYQQLLASEEEIKAQLKAHGAETSGKILMDMTDQQRQIRSLKEEQVKASDIDARQLLKGPVSGRVQELVIHTAGGIVTDAQQLMIIVPDEEQLEVEVLLENKDIGFVHEDLPAEIKIHTYPFTKYGVIEAEITNISNDATVDEQKGLVYRMQLQLASNTILVDGKTVSLMPGMAVTAEVQTGKRRIIEFFLARLLRHKKESIRER